MIAVYAIVEASSDGWGSAPTLGFGASAVLLMAAFIARQATAATPLMNLRVLSSRDVFAANAIQMLLLAGLFGMFFLGALYLQHILGYDPLQVGLALLPFAIGIGIMSLGVTGPLIARPGARVTLVPGMTLVAVASSCCAWPEPTRTTSPACYPPSPRWASAAAWRSRRSSIMRCRPPPNRTRA